MGSRLLTAGLARLRNRVSTASRALSSNDETGGGVPWTCYDDPDVVIPKGRKWPKEPPTPEDFKLKAQLKEARRWMYSGSSDVPVEGRDNGPPPSHRHLLASGEYVTSAELAAHLLEWCCGERLSNPLKSPKKINRKHFRFQNMNVIWVTLEQCYRSDGFREHLKHAAQLSERPVKGPRNLAHPTKFFGSFERVSWEENPERALPPFDVGGVKKCFEWAKERYAFIYRGANNYWIPAKRWQNARDGLYQCREPREGLPEFIGQPNKPKKKDGEVEVESTRGQAPMDATPPYIELARSLAKNTDADWWSKEPSMEVQKKIERKIRQIKGVKNKLC